MMHHRSDGATRALGLLLIAAVLAGVSLVVGATPSSAWNNACTNGETVNPSVIPPTGEDLGNDFGPGILFVGVDLELASLAAGNPGPIVCVNDDGYSVRLITTGGPYADARHCTTPSTCGTVVGATGLQATSAPTVSIPTTNVCVGVCVPVPTTPIEVDTGYDVVVNGGKVADVCVSVATSC